MSKPFTITPEERPHPVPVLRLAGRLDADGAHALRSQIMVLKERGTTHVIVHLTDLEFVASSGLGTFLLLTEEFLDVGGDIAFVAPGPEVRQVIELMNIDQFLHLVDSEEEALAAVPS